jgi:hypothetical protein
MNKRKRQLSHLHRSAALSALLVLLLSFSQELARSQNSLTPPTGVLRIRARVKTGETMRGLARKRFFLIRGSLEQHSVLVTAVEQNQTISRDCYYRNAGASEALITWLRGGDCESVYCREVEEKDLSGTTAVPEFVTAVAAGEKEFGNRNIARRWLSTKVPEKLRDGFYRDRQLAIESLLKLANSSSAVSSVMTDRNGTAYFTDLSPGKYVLTSLVPAEIAGMAVNWNCEVEIKAGDLATERPYQLSNIKDRNVKCVGSEKPLPTCAAVKTAER